MAGMLLRHNVFQFLLSFIITTAIKEKDRVAEVNLKWGVLWVVSVCSVKPRCVLCFTHVQSEWNFNFVRLRSALCWDISQRIVANPYQNCLVKGTGFCVGSILFLKMILDNRGDLYRFHSDFNDSFPSPGFTSEKWKSFRCVLSFIWFKTYTKHKSSLSQYLTNLMHKICFTISFISCLYMFRAHVLII